MTEQPLTLAGRRSVENLCRALAWHGDPIRMSKTREEWQQDIDAAVAWVKANPEDDRSSFPTTPQLLAGEAEPVLVSREEDEDCGCPEEYWDAFGLSIHMHLSDAGSNAHADGGDWGEAEIEVRASTHDLTRAAIFGWARALTAAPASLSIGERVNASGEGTPAAKWREDGEADPFGDRYKRERAALCGGRMTDDELANAVYLDPSIMNLTAAKDRIRWLSRALTASLPASQPVADVEAKYRDELAKRLIGEVKYEQTIATLTARVATLEGALARAIRVAGEAAAEWDAAPAAMKAGKLLLALAGANKKYRADIDAIHAALCPDFAGKASAD